MLNEKHNNHTISSALSIFKIIKSKFYLNKTLFIMHLKKDIIIAFTN